MFWFILFQLLPVSSTDVWHEWTDGERRGQQHAQTEVAGYVGVLVSQSKQLYKNSRLIICILPPNHIKPRMPIYYANRLVVKKAWKCKMFYHENLSHYMLVSSKGLNWVYLILLKSHNYLVLELLYYRVKDCSRVINMQWWFVALVTDVCIKRTQRWNKQEVNIYLHLWKHCPYGCPLSILLFKNIIY